MPRALGMAVVVPHKTATKSHTVWPRFYLEHLCLSLRERGLESGAVFIGTRKQFVAVSSISLSSLRKINFPRSFEKIWVAYFSFAWCFFLSSKPLCNRFKFSSKTLRKYQQLTCTCGSHKRRGPFTTLARNPTEYERGDGGCAREKRAKKGSSLARDTADPARVWRTATLVRSSIHNLTPFRRSLHKRALSLPLSLSLFSE